MQSPGAHAMKRAVQLFGRVPDEVVLALWIVVVITISTLAR